MFFLSNVLSNSSFLLFFWLIVCQFDSCLPFVGLFVSLTVCPFVYLFVCLLFVGLFVNLFVCLFVCLCVCLFVCLIVCLFIIIMVPGTRILLSRTIILILPAASRLWIRIRRLGGCLRQPAQVHFSTSSSIGVSGGFIQFLK